MKDLKAIKEYFNAKVKEKGYGYKYDDFEIIDLDTDTRQKMGMVKGNTIFIKDGLIHSVCIDIDYLMTREQRLQRIGR
jgi:hypothetical protein